MSVAAEPNVHVFSRSENAQEIGFSSINWNPTLIPHSFHASAFVAAADALGPRTVKCAVLEPKKYALWRGTVAMTV